MHNSPPERFRPVATRPAGKAYEAERLICHNIRPFIVDLCYVDRSFLVASVASRNHGAINDIIESSSEMFFKPGTLRYTFGSHVSERRDPAGRHDAAPAVSFGMRFAHELVAVSFLLHLANDFAGVALADGSMPYGRSAEALGQLSAAFCAARLSGGFDLPHDCDPKHHPFH